MPLSKILEALEGDERMDELDGNGQLPALTAEVLKAAIQNHLVKDIHDIPRVARSIRNSLMGTADSAPEPIVSDNNQNLNVTQSQQKPAVPIEQSVTPEFISCLECGKRFRSLKRHLGNEHDLTAEQYMSKWSLPYDYPLNAPKYSAERSRLARDLGLGRKSSEPKSSGTPTFEDDDPRPKSMRGRRGKASEAAA